MKLVIENAQITPDGKPVTMEGGRIAFFATLAWMGGSARVENPKKLHGLCTDVVMSVVVKTDARAWTTKDKSRMGAMQVREVVLGEILDGKAAK